MKKTILMATIICVLFFVMSSMCFADDVIHGCVGKFTGILRVVSSTSKCLPIESPISWNIQGPQGLQGVQGLPGVANGITAAAYAYVNSNGTFVPAIPPSEAVLRVDYASSSPGNYFLVLDPAVFPSSFQPRCIVNTLTPGVTCAQWGGTAAEAQIDCHDANHVLTDASFSVICVQ
jgi:hypothetical protein